MTRELATHEVGDPHGVPVLYLHGSGSSRLEADVYAAEAAELGVRLIAWDRPGAGGSPGYVGRSIADVVADARQILRERSLSRARAAVGLSGGATHVLALAALAPDVADRFISINPGGPATSSLVSSLPLQMRLLVRSARQPWLIRQLARPMERMGADLNATLASRLRTATMDPQDLAVLRDPEVNGPFAAASREGSRQPGAWLTEARLFWAQDWPFEPLTVTSDLHVFSGAEDPFRQFALQLAQQGAELHTFEGGHVSGFARDVRRDIMQIASLSRALPEPRPEDR